MLAAAEVVARWRDYRQRQRGLLRDSNRLRWPTTSLPTNHEPEQDEQLAHDLLTDTLGPNALEHKDVAEKDPRENGIGQNGVGRSADRLQRAQRAQPTGGSDDRLDGGEPAGEAEAEAVNQRRFGQAGQPLNRHSPLYVGFVGATGVLGAYALWNALGQMGQVFTLLIIALFVTLALDPIVAWLTCRGLRRGYAVTLVFVGLVGVFTAIGLIVVPPVAAQGSALATNAPAYLANLLDNHWVRTLDGRYHVIPKLQAEVQSRLTDGSFMSGVFGGVLGAGRAVLSGFFSFFTVLVLTLYFLGALPSFKRAAYAMVPATRRPRVMSLSEEVMRRVGSYALGQVAIATVNAFASFVMMSIVGIPYPAVLAVAVGFLGLVPMVGAGLGATVVCVVAVFDEPRKAIIALV